MICTGEAGCAAHAGAGAIVALRAGANDETPPDGAWTVRPLQEHFPAM